MKNLILQRTTWGTLGLLSMGGLGVNAWAASDTPPVSQEQKERPNILFILSDDHTS